MDTIFIRELKVSTLIGVYGWEREVRQVLILDLEMASDTARAGSSDQLAHTVDYSAVAVSIVELAHAASFELIEAFAEAVANTVLNEFGVPWLKLTVCKPGAVPDARDVGLIIERGERA